MRPLGIFNKTRIIVNRCVLLRLARLLLVSVVLLACQRPDVVQIGLIVSFEARRAASIAIDELNREAPRRAPRIGLVSPPYSPPSSAAPAITIASELAADDRVIAVVGHSNSSATLAAAPLYNRARLVHIAPTSTNRALRDAGDYTFTLVPNDEVQARFVADVVLSSDPHRLGIVFVNDDYGRGLLTLIRRNLPAGVTTLEIPYRELPDFQGENGTIDRAAAVNADPFQATIDRLRSFMPDQLLWIGRPAPLGDFLDSIPAELRRVPIMGTDALDSPLLYLNDGSRFKGVRFVRYIDPGSLNPRVVAIRDAVHRSGSDFSSEALLTYDAVRLIGQAVHDGAHTRRRVRDYIARVGSDLPPYEGASGSIVFDEAGEVTRHYELVEVTSVGVAPVNR